MMGVRSGAGRTNHTPSSLQSADGSVSLGLRQQRGTTANAFGPSRVVCPSSPAFPNLVAAVNIDPGDSSAVPGKPAITLVEVNRLRVEVQISDVDIVRVAVGQQARVELDGLPDRPYTGTVSYIAPTPTVAGNVRAYLVRVLLDNPVGLRTGMSVRVELSAR